MPDDAGGSFPPGEEAGYPPRNQPPPGYPYGYPAGGYPYGPPAGPRNEGMAVAALVTSIASLVLSLACGIGFVAAIVALVLASQADQKIRESAGALTGESLTKAARILSWIDLGLTGLVVIGAIAVFAIGASTATLGR